MRVLSPVFRLPILLQNGATKISLPWLRQPSAQLVFRFARGRMPRLYVFFQDNTFWEDGKENPWSKTHKKGEFTGLKIPCGARVLFKPSDTCPDDNPTKWAPDSLEGVVAGFCVQPAYAWFRQYLV